MTLNTVDICTYYGTYMLIQNYSPHKTTTSGPLHSLCHPYDKRTQTVVMSGEETTTGIRGTGPWYIYASCLVFQDGMERREVTAAGL